VAKAHLLIVTDVVVGGSLRRRSSYGVLLDLPLPASSGTRSGSGVRRRSSTARGSDDRSRRSLLRWWCRRVVSDDDVLSRLPVWEMSGFDLVGGEGKGVVGRSVGGGDGAGGRRSGEVGRGCRSTFSSGGKRRRRGGESVICRVRRKKWHGRKDARPSID